MKILVLGGTRFLGRHLVEAALERGHEVTMFNRGKSGAGLYPEVESLLGDRDGGLGALEGRSFDAVLDTSGYVPRVVRQAGELLAERVGHYTFVSSLSVYADLEPNGDETRPLATTDEPGSEEVLKHYGALKALCEQTLESLLPGRVLHARAGLIVGPYDPMNRFPYWLRRIAAGGDVLAGSDPEAPQQLIDARDLAGWLLSKAEDGKAGTFNVTGPEKPLSFGEVLETIRDVVGGNARFVWVEEQFLLENGVEPMDGLPLWIPREAVGFNLRNVERALACGLKLRPLAETVRDTWQWLQGKPQPAEAAETPIQSGLAREREAELLAAWHARTRPD
jgi:2'-hydroxyisoflavone reductase